MKLIEDILSVLAANVALVLLGVICLAVLTHQLGVHRVATNRSIVQSIGGMFGKLIPWNTGRSDNNQVATDTSPIGMPSGPSRVRTSTWLLYDSRPFIEALSKADPQMGYLWAPYLSDVLSVQKKYIGTQRAAEMMARLKTMRVPIILMDLMDANPIGVILDAREDNSIVEAVLRQAEIKFVPLHLNNPASLKAAYTAFGLRLPDPAPNPSARFETPVISRPAAASVEPGAAKDLFGEVVAEATEKKRKTKPKKKPTQKPKPVAPKKAPKGPNDQDHIGDMPSRRTKIVPNEAPRAPKKRQKLEAPDEIADLVELADTGAKAEADVADTELNEKSKARGAESEETNDARAIEPLKSVPVPVKFHPF
ncbi:MAG: hypothetical protein AAGF33_00480 [Pseudomonadota bacterium]